MKKKRVTLKEKISFFRVFLGALKKLDRPKNIKKCHWSECGNHELLSMLSEEYDELYYALQYESELEVVDECYDVINFALMIADNIKGKMKFYER